MTNEPLTRTELLMLQRALRSHDGIFIGRITTSLGISIKDASNAFRVLRERGFLEERDASLFLTSRGRGWIMMNQEHFAFTGKKPWREVPERFQANSIGPFEPYAPRLSKLSKRAFSLGGSRDEC